MTATESRPAEMSVAAADLYQCILREPENDDVRLLFADEIDGTEPDRAEFIRAMMAECRCRVQHAHPSCEVCHVVTQYAMYGPIPDDLREVINGGGEWRLTATREDANGVNFQNSESKISVVFSRGFPSAVSMTLRQFMGGPCERCEGQEARGFPCDCNDHIQNTCEYHNRRKCHDCKGSGHIDGLAADLAKRWPVTEINISDRIPFGPNETGVEYGIGWQRKRLADSIHGANPGVSYGIPDELFNKMSGEEFSNRAKYYDSRAAAMTALSNAAVDLARHLAGLKPIRWK